MKFEPDLLSLLSLREVQKLARVTQQSSILIRDFLVSHLVLSPQTNESPLIKTVRVTGGSMLPYQRQVGSYIQM